MPTIRIPTPLRPYTNSQAEIPVSGTTVGAVTHDPDVIRSRDRLSDGPWTEHVYGKYLTSVTLAPEAANPVEMAAGMEIISRSEIYRGAPTYRGRVFVRRDSGIETLEDILWDIDQALAEASKA